MVTKRGRFFGTNQGGSVLAKIFMVTKHLVVNNYVGFGSVLAKIFMVTKRRVKKYGNV